MFSVHGCLTQGPLDIDEAIQVARSMTNGDPNCILLVLLPQIHSGIAQETVTMNRRALEDKLSGLLSCKSSIPASFFFMYFC